MINQSGKLQLVLRFCILGLLWSTTGLVGRLDAQVPIVEWHKGHGTDRSDHVHYGLESRDGGYIMAGETADSRRSSDMLVVKTDHIGELQWQKIIGTPRRHDFATFVMEVGDGFIVTGALDVDGVQQRALLKLDVEGNIVWQRTYRQQGNGSLRGAAMTGDGGLVATGYIGSDESGYGFIHDGGQGSLLETDADGNRRWEKTLSSVVHGIRVHPVADGYVVSGVSTRAGRNFALVKTNHAGDIQWQQNYGDDVQEDIFDSDATSDGGFILAGHKLMLGRVRDDTDIFDFYLVKVDGNGKLQWSKTFGQPRGYDPRHIRDECYGVKQTPDGGYIMVGGSGDEDSYSASGHEGGPSDIWKSYVVKTDAQGHLLWQAVFGDPAGNNAGEYINLTRDGGYVIFTDSDTAGAMRSSNFGLMKLRPASPE